jgi:hypothetical protein
MRLSSVVYSTKGGIAKIVLSECRQDEAQNRFDCCNAILATKTGWSLVEDFPTGTKPFTCEHGSTGLIRKNARVEDIICMLGKAKYHLFCDPQAKVMNCLGMATSTLEATSYINTPALQTFATQKTTNSPRFKTQ